MSGDNASSAGRSSKKLARAEVGWPPALREFKELLYEAYVAADCPSLTEIAGDIAEDDDQLLGAPSRDTVHRCISAPTLPTKMADAVSVAVVLARRAAWDEADLTHRIRSLWISAQTTASVGRPIAEFDDQLILNDLEVHHALKAAGDDGRLGALPAYVTRGFDPELRKVVAAAANGHSGAVVLVGGSSTGKTRSAWEAVKELPRGWRLWHPDSSRLDGVLAQLDDVGPRTVVWLNEAQRYLDAGGLGEQVAAGMRRLLNEPARTPVLVLATLWPERWATLTTRGGGDAHDQARELLTGNKIDVPDEFTDSDFAALTDISSADPRLVEAGNRAQGRQVTQYLAGVPVLLERFHAASASTKAFIHTAMDARRLGASENVPQAWLADAALSYLTAVQLRQTPDDWLEQALTYVMQPCNGIPGILSPPRTLPPGRQWNRRGSGEEGRSGSQVRYGASLQLADYLDQYGGSQRAGQIPPTGFWTAAAKHAQVSDLPALAAAARARGLEQDTAQLLKRATAHGSLKSALPLLSILCDLHPNDQRPAHWVAMHVALDHPAEVATLLDRLRKAGAQEHFATLAARAAAGAALDAPSAVATLLDSLRKAGEQEHLATLASRAAAGAALDDPSGVARLLDHLRQAGEQEHLATLASRAAAGAALDDPSDVARLLDSLRQAGEQEHLATLASRAAAGAALDDPSDVARLLDSLRQAGEQEHLATLASRAAARVAVKNPSTVATLLDSLCQAGAQEHLATLATRAAAHVALKDPDLVARLLNSLRRSGAEEHIATLLARGAATNVTLDNPVAVATLLDSLRQAGAQEHLATLAARAAAEVTLARLGAVATLLDSLREADAPEHFATLAARTAAQASLDNPLNVGWLLDSFRRAEATENFVTLATRTATHSLLGDPIWLQGVLHCLPWAGAEKQVATLLARIPAAHVNVEDLEAVVRLMGSLRRAGAKEQDAILATRAAAGAALNHPGAVATLLNSLREAGHQEQVATLLARNPAAHVNVEDLEAVVRLMGSLRRAGAKEQDAILATRAAAGAALNHPGAVATLLNSLREAGHQEQVATLLARNPAAHVNVESRGELTHLLNSLEEAGFEEQTAVLLARLPGVGLFELFKERSDDPRRFRFGREPDGGAADRWGWEHLE